MLRIVDMLPWEEPWFKCPDTTIAQVYNLKASAITNVKPMQQDLPFSLKMIHHALLSFLTNVKVKMKVKNKQNEDMK